MSKFSDRIRLICFVILWAAHSNCKQPEKQASQTANYETVFNQTWADSTFWDDGKAEVAQYEATREIYGKPREFEYTFITVSEHFNEAFDVKTDDYTRKDLYRVIKLNAFANIPTDNYPYHFLSSLFFSRENSIDLFKATFSSQEWCGNTFKEFIENDDEFRINFNSYWDNEGSGSRKIANTEKMLFEDQLIYSLRSLKFKNGLEFSAAILPSQVGNKVGKQEVTNARFKVSEHADFWQVEMVFKDDRINNYKFEKRYPNILIEQTTWNNQNLKLKSSSRSAYWQN